MRKTVGFGLVALLLSALFAPAAVQATVIPNDRENVAGTSAFLGPLANSQRTYQLLIHSSQLTDLVGLELNGLSMRIPPSATSAWPPADLSYSNYDIYLSGSVDPANRSLTFADNVVGPQTQVRSGSLDVAAGSYAFGGSPNEFGPSIDFSPYLYTGGNLLVEIRHLGSTGTSRSVDAMAATGGAGQGYGTLFSAAWTGNYSGVTGTQGNFAVIQLHAVPEPAGLLVMAVGCLLIGFRRYL